MTEFNVYEFMQSKLRNCFRDSPNIDSLIHMLSVPIQDRVDVANFILGMTDIDTREGVFLDQVGSKTGVKRPLKQVPDDHLFTLYDEDEIGDEWDEYTCFGEEGEDEIGGYMVDENGLDTGDGQLMNDPDYRILLNQKAETFRSQMTDENLIKYLLVYGAPSDIEEENTLKVVITPENDGDLSQWERWYILNRGYKPAGIRIQLNNTTGAAPL
jgi:hypothetical protein